MCFEVFDVAMYFTSIRNGHPLIVSYTEFETPNNVNRYAPVEFSLSTNPYI